METLVKEGERSFCLYNEALFESVGCGADELQKLRFRVLVGLERRGEERTEWDMVGVIHCRTLEVVRKVDSGAET